MSNFQEYDKNALSKQLNNIIDDSRDKTPKKKMYFAGPWFDIKTAMLYDACQSIVKLNEAKNRYIVSFPRDINFPSTKETFNEDVRLIKECDVVVALVDTKDVGTAWEIGMAYVLGKPIYLLGLDSSTFKSKTNLMLAYTGKCFTLDKFAKFLTKGLKSDEFLKFSEKWEDIE